MILAEDPTTETETPVEQESSYYKTLAALLGAPVALALTREQVAAPFTPATRNLLREPLGRVHQGFLDYLDSVSEHSVRNLTEATTTPSERLANREVTGLMQTHFTKKGDVYGEMSVGSLGTTPGKKIRTPVSQALTVSHELPHLADALRQHSGGTPYPSKIKEALMDAVGYSIAPNELKSDYLNLDPKRFEKMFARRQHPTFRKNMALLLKIMRKGR